MTFIFKIFKLPAHGPVSDNLDVSSYISLQTRVLEPSQNTEVHLTGGLRVSGQLHGKSGGPDPWGTVLQWWEQQSPVLQKPQLQVKV